MLGQYGFLAKVFNARGQGGTTDCVATAGGFGVAAADPAESWSRDLVQEELDALVEEFENARIARVKVTTGHSRARSSGTSSGTTVIRSAGSRRWATRT